MSGTRYVPNQTLDKDFRESDVIRDDLLEVAQEIVDRFQATAPRRSGAYADSAEAQVGLLGRETVARVVVKDYKANWLEFGTSIRPMQAPLRRAVEGAGYKQPEGGDK